ncbi:MAG: ABC-type transport auxiliary lipoprotein family protein [Caulobacteraceae bacterium]|nr:ABC-type transport auxiliary lipoprotein family protein [Caulobacteraceae bacterium]
MRPYRGLALAAATVVALGLGGCITLFPKTQPAQLYAFGNSFPAGPAPADAGGPPINVVSSRTEFERAAASDRILTVNNREAGYIANSRWISSAAVLFDEAESRAFTADAGRARLVRAGQMASAAAALQLDVPTFEARYPGSLSAAPTVVVEVRAILVALPDRHVLGEQTFTVSKPAGTNRVGEIVQAFDAATVEALSQVATWTDAQVAQPKS